MIVKNELRSGLARRRKARWTAFGSIQTILEDIRDTQLHAKLFDATVLPALWYPPRVTHPSRTASNPLAGLPTRQQQRSQRQGLNNQTLAYEGSKQEFVEGLLDPLQLTLPKNGMSK